MDNLNVSNLILKIFSFLHGHFIIRTICLVNKFCYSSILSQNNLWFTKEIINSNYGDLDAIEYYYHIKFSELNNDPHQFYQLMYHNLYFNVPQSVRGFVYKILKSKFSCSILMFFYYSNILYRLLPSLPSLSPTMMLYWIKHCYRKTLSSNCVTIGRYVTLWETFYWTKYFEKREYYFQIICEFVKKNYNFIRNCSNTECTLFPPNLNIKVMLQNMIQKYNFLEIKIVFFF